MKILITESIAEESVQYLRDRGYEVEEYLGHSQEEIEQYIKGFDAIIVRSATKINETLLNNADCLKAPAQSMALSLLILLLLTTWLQVSLP